MDVLGPETVASLPHIRPQAIDAHGFINLRCAHTPGCPIGVNPTNPTQTDIDNKDIRAYFAQAYQELFDVSFEQVPEHIGNVCCAQFAVSRERIRSRPRSDYERMLDWAHGTNLTHDFGVGWVFEKIWHIVFLMDTTQYVFTSFHVPFVFLTVVIVVRVMNNAAVIIMDGAVLSRPERPFVRWEVSRAPRVMSTSRR